jgi:hypothetical protein
MNSSRGFWGVVLLGVSVAILFLAGFASDKISDNARAYQAEMVALKGQETSKILDKLASWKFELVDAWITETPALTDFKKHNRGKTKFTKQEIAEIFDPAGKFKVAVYGIQVATNSATQGTVDQFGMSYQKDATVDLQVFTVIRLVFKDEKLIDARTWAKMESSAIAGGTWYLRH